MLAKGRASKYELLTKPARLSIRPFIRSTSIGFYGLNFVFTVSSQTLNPTDSRSFTSSSTTSDGTSGRAARSRFPGRIDLLASHPGLSFQRLSAKGDGLP